MKVKATLIPAFLLLSPLMLFISCNQQKAEWKGTIEEVDGVTVVKNPKEPIYGEDVFSLEEELSIGVIEGREEYMFSQARGVAVDEEERIYILDSKESHIKVFDRNGDYVKTIGKKGQGPGEMQMPLFLQITSQDEVLINDYLTQHLIFFSLDGKYLRQKSTARTRYPVLAIKLDSHGNLIGTENMAPPPIGGKELKKYDSNLNPLMTIAKEEKDESRKKREFDIAKPSFYCDVSPNDNIVWGDSNKYILQVLDSEGELIRKIQKEYGPLKITEKDRERYKKRYSEAIKIGFKLNFPEHFPAFSDISVDDEERIFVKSYERVEGKEDFFYFDVFDSEGKYIVKIPLAVLPRVWKKNKLYTIEEDEEGYQVVKRYKVTWKY